MEIPSFLKSKPKVWIVSDGTHTVKQSRQLAKKITDKKHIIELDQLHAHTEGKKFPELAIGVGFNCAESLLDIKERSKNKTKIAIILDPLKEHKNFDYIILPSYEPYHVEGHVIKITGLINYINPKYLENFAKNYVKDERYKPIFDKSLEEPLTALIVGGKHTGGNVTQQDAEEISKVTNRIIKYKGGSLLVSNSPRTEEPTTTALKNNLEVPHFFYDYHQRSMDNPYDLYLALADEIIVTGDSVRMMSEVCSAGKNVRIYQPKELGFQYPPLIQELIEGNFAVDFYDQRLNYTCGYLDEASRVGGIIRESL